jgi:hypothetical protein
MAASVRPARDSRSPKPGAVVAAGDVGEISAAPGVAPVVAVVPVSVFPAVAATVYEWVVEGFQIPVLPIAFVITAASSRSEGLLRLQLAITVLLPV